MLIQHANIANGFEIPWFLQTRPTTTSSGFVPKTCGWGCHSFLLFTASSVSENSKGSRFSTGKQHFAGFWGENAFPPQTKTSPNELLGTWVLVQMFFLSWYCWWFRNPKQPPGMYKTQNSVNNGTNYQPQLVSRISSCHQQDFWGCFSGVTWKVTSNLPTSNKKLGICFFVDDFFYGFYHGDFGDFLLVIFCWWFWFYHGKWPVFTTLWGDFFKPYFFQAPEKQI